MNREPAQEGDNRLRGARGSTRVEMALGGAGSSLTLVSTAPHSLGRACMLDYPRGKARKTGWLTAQGWNGAQFVN